ncbi:MAG TPA: NAD(P)H-dependent oxidoreductase [Chthonomonadaceae bacterium]|nr:NAD(P)H-dependent oxidoreductase [Chthonomonadaceae bacterium]
MPHPIHVLGFSGSLRKGSYNAALLRAAGDLLPEGVTLETFDIAPIPLYNQDVEQAGHPQAVTRFKERIDAADALLIVTPEYNYSIPGVLKNAIDWASRNPNSFNGKPIAFMGASMGMLGSARAQYHLRQVCVYLNMYPINKPEVLVASAHEKFDAEGILTDEMSRSLVSSLLQSLADWTRRLRGE